MRPMTTTPRADALAARLHDASRELISVVEGVDDRAWRHVPTPSVWSIGKEADHVAEASLYHQWIVRLTIGERVTSARPRIERQRMTTELEPVEVVACVRERTDTGARRILGLTDAQLNLVTRPARARNERLAQTIERLLIGHYVGHRLGIERKLRELAR